MMDLVDLMDALTDAEAMLLEPRAVFDSALIGMAEAAGGLCVAAYDTEKCIEAIRVALECDYDEASDYFHFNTLGAYMGEGTPVFIDVLSRGRHAQTATYS